MILHYTDESPGPFHRAIIQSGSATTRDCRPHNSDIIEQYFAEFLAQLGCPPTLSAAETFAFLRTVPLTAIIAAQDAVFNTYKPTMQWAFRPVIDGSLIPRSPLESWRSGKYYKVPIMTGFSSNEGSLYVDRTLSRPEQFTLFMKTLLPSLPDQDLARLETLYPDPSTGDSAYRDSRVGGDLSLQYLRTEAAYGQFALIAPVRQTAHLASSTPNAPPVYLYHWDVSTTLYGGAAHADNLRYETFDSATTSISEGQKEVSGMFHAYLTSFICHGGDPNKLQGRYAHRPKWQPYSHDRPLTMILGKGNRELIGGEVGVPAELVHETSYDEQCQFWWDRTRLTQQ
jgi:carboxylesterase type B